MQELAKWSDGSGHWIQANLGLGLSWPVKVKLRAYEDFPKTSRILIFLWVEYGNDLRAE